ncbi:MAG: hypothetical protein RL736_947 [Pseudomonadota bacterium]|jgi:hypothetical protein
MENNKNTGAGKGDKPRNCFSEQYRNNYDSIIWCKKLERKQTQDEKVIDNTSSSEFLPKFE